MCLTGLCSERHGDEHAGSPPDDPQDDAIARALAGDRLGEKVVWQMLRLYAAEVGVPGIAPHDLRRTCAKLCHSNGGELEQIQFLLGHARLETTARYLQVADVNVRATTSPLEKLESLHLIPPKE